MIIAKNFETLSDNKGWRNVEHLVNLILFEEFFWCSLVPPIVE